MQSKTLFFNRTLFRKNLTRFWPLWVVPSFVGALFPLAMLTQMLSYGAEGVFGRSDNYALEFTGMYYDVVAYALPVISLCYAVLVALAVWSYLFNNRSTGLMHTLPIRREGLFFTNFLSGMTMMLVPYVVTGALCILISLCFGFFEPVGPLVTILAVLGDSLFYFCTATAAAFVTGNLFAMPVLYFIFHFLAVGMETLVSVFAGGFLFGLSSGNYPGMVEFLSPTVYLMRHVYTHHEYEEVFVSDPAYGSLTADGIGYYDSQIVAVSLEEAWIIAVYALVGIVLLAVAYALYRKRRSECAGDVVAVGWMKPVFRYGVSICAAMAGGLALYMVFWGQFQSGSKYDAFPMLIAMVISGAIGYYAASMLLAKSLRVFRGSWKGLAITALCAAVICGVMKFDLLGIETRVPTANQIETLSFRVANNQYDLMPEEDGELIEEIRAVHLAIAEDADYIIATNEDWDRLNWSQEEISPSNSLRLIYHLKNGTTVTRRYNVPVSADRLAQEGTYDYALNQLVNGEALKAMRFHLYDGYKADNGYLYMDSWRDSQRDSISFGTYEALAIHEAVKRDVAAGTCGTYDWFDQSRAGQYAIDLNLDFYTDEKRDNGATYSYYDSINVAVYPGMTHTVEALLSLGLAEEDDFKTYAEMHPEDYDANYNEYLEKFGYVEYDDYLAVRYGVGTVGAIDAPAASIGIIGGADGPTEIFVAAG